MAENSKKAKSRRNRKEYAAFVLIRLSR